MDISARNSVIGAVLAAIAITALVVAYYMVDIDQTREARMPDVKIEGGQTPEFEVETGKVKVGTEERTVTVPDVDVKMKEKKVSVPTVNIETPKDE